MKNILKEIMNIFLTLISVSEFLNSNFTNTTECNSTECKEANENLPL